MIFYFSATGNSKYVADRVATATGDEAVSIIDWRDGRRPASTGHSETVGIVSPTYAWGLPTVVHEFLQGLTLEEKPAYLWFAATFGTTPGQTGRLAERALREKGLQLYAKFSVRMPDTWTPLFDLSDQERVRRINEAAEAQIDGIAAKVQARACGDFMARKTPPLLSNMVYGLEYDAMRRTGHFTVEDSCVGCGLCAKRCPVRAIEMREGRPAWVADRCAMCLGCLHRCPKFAIQYGPRTKRHGQYVHPGP